MKKYTFVSLEKVQDNPTLVVIDDPKLGERVGPVHYEPNPPVFDVPDVEFHNPKSEEIEWKEPKTDPDSFSKIRRSGRIKMSRYRRGKISIEYPTFKVHGKDVRKSGSWDVKPPGHSKFNLPDNFTHQIVIHSSNSSYWRAFKVGPHQFYEIGRVDETKGYSDYNTLGTQLSHIPDISSDIETLKSDVATRLYKRWDALTDMAEGRQTFQMAKSLLGSVRRPLETYKAFQDRKPRHKKSKTAQFYDKELRSKWLEFRYGIMPTMYSIQDIVKLLEEKDKEYLTERARTELDIKSEPVPEREGVFTITTGSILINATARARFETPSSRLIGGTSLNVINTLWEVIPYSLVVDWFANVGDFLYHRSAIFPQSFESQMCYSVRRKLKHTTFARVINPNGSFTDHPIRIEEEDTYERIPFNRSDIQLSFNPKFTSWKRWADAYALSVGPLTRALRRLK